MIRADVDDLIALIERFLAGGNSVKDADEIEGLLIESFADTEIFEELTEPLALFRPGGGPQYVDKAELSELLAEHLPRLKEMSRHMRDPLD